MSVQSFFLLCAAAIGLLFLLVGFWDVWVQKKHAILHNFPVVGHARYLLERIGPELRQYWVAHDKEERPFNRSERAWVYATSKGENNHFGFGTSEELYQTGYPIIKHATFPFPSESAVHPPGDPSAIPCAKVIGATHNRKRPYRPSSIVNISAMSFGSLGERAIAALNIGAREAGAFHNTGEGGVSPHHLQGGDLIYQLGTGYYGARTKDGQLCLDTLAEVVASNPSIRAIEIKLSQGAKPGKGGILPASKVTAEIGRIRGIPPGQSCLSPNTHRAFSTVEELIDCIERIADRTGLPVGIKSAVGQLSFWTELADCMRASTAGPDFIAIDGGEGGTGAAPLAFSDHVSLPFKIGFDRVYSAFQAVGMAEKVVWIGSGKLGFPDRVVVAMAMGCDCVSIAREAMMAVGCIQAQKCHTGHCPAGVATQNKWLQAGLNVDDKSERMTRYLRGLRKEVLSLTHAAGYEHPCQFMPTDIEFYTGVNTFTDLGSVLGYRKDPTQFTDMETLFRL
jgi:glutamate synthase domain-containing protein 2